MMVLELPGWEGGAWGRKVDRKLIFDSRGSSECVRPVL